jgi:hypothetical protein
MTCPNGRSALKQRRETQNLAFLAPLKKKSPLLTSGEPRRRSFFGLIRSLKRASRRRCAGTRRDVSSPETVKNYISCRQQASSSSSDRCAGLAAIDVAAGAVFCLSKPMSAPPQPAGKASEGRPMRISDLTVLTAASSSPGSVNSAKISYSFRRTSGTVSRHLRACSAEVGRL